MEETAVFVAWLYLILVSYLGDYLILKGGVVALAPVVVVVMQKPHQQPDILYQRHLNISQNFFGARVWPDGT